MFSFKPLTAVMLWLALSMAAVHAEPPASDNGQPGARLPASPVAGKNLTERSLTAMSQTANKIGDAINTGAQALGAGVQHVTSQAAALVEHARQSIGTPYRWGGTSAATGFDCSGFVRAMVQQTVGKLLPHHAAQQAAVTQKIDKDQLQPGDLVFFNTVRPRAYSHVGIYMGGGQFIHAPARGESVRIDNLSAAYWQRHFKGARRLFTDASFPGNGLLAGTDTPDSIAPQPATSLAPVPDHPATGDVAALGAAHDDAIHVNPAINTANANIANADPSSNSTPFTPVTNQADPNPPARLTDAPKPSGRTRFHTSARHRHGIAKRGHPQKRKIAHPR